MSESQAINQLSREKSSYRCVICNFALGKSGTIVYDDLEDGYVHEECKKAAKQDAVRFFQRRSVTVSIAGAFIVALMLGNPFSAVYAQHTDIESEYFVSE